MDLILASASPRRRWLLREAGFEFEIRVPDVDETPRADEEPGAMAERLARDKAGAVPCTGRVVLGADTIVVLGDRSLGKPRDADDAVRMLSELAGNEHRVLTGWALRRGDSVRSGVEESRVRLRELDRAEIAAYVATGEPLDKAGAYAVQGGAGRFVESIAGSRSNVIGLPIEVVVPALAELGVLPA